MFTITRNMTPVVGPVGFDTITLFNSVAVAGSAPANIILLNTEVLTILFTDGISLPVTLNVAFNVISADGAPIVPLPATGIMLLTGLAGAAFVARRKQKKSA
jgi:high-affinity nickel permease